MAGINERYRQWRAVVVDEALEADYQVPADIPANMRKQLEADRVLGVSGVGPVCEEQSYDDEINDNDDLNSVNSVENLRVLLVQSASCSWSDPVKLVVIRVFERATLVARNER